MIYLLRHAETQWNFQLRKQGLDDSPLTDNGERQAMAYGETLRRLIPGDHIREGRVRVHASPLGRTQNTAGRLIQALDIPSEYVHYEPRLIEFDYGDWSGLTNDEIEDRYPGELDARESNKWYYTVPNGECYADVEAKVDQWMDDLLPEHTVIAVTHSVVSRVIRRRYLNLSRCDAGRLEHPQHLIFRLNGNTIDEIDVFA